MNNIYNQYKIRFLILPGLIFLLGFNAISQENRIALDKSWDGLHWNAFVSRAEKEFSVKFFYLPDSVPDLIMSVKRDSVLLTDVLAENLQPHNLYVAADQNGNLFINGNQKFRTALPKSFFRVEKQELEPEDTVKYEPDQSDYLKTRNEYVAKSVVIGTRKEGMRSGKAILSGKVASSSDGSPIISGNLYFDEIERGTTTDENGNYSITLKKGTYTLTVSSLDSEPQKFKLEVLSSGTLNIQLVPKLYTLAEFVVSSEKDRHVRGTQMGFEKVSIKNIKEVPVVLGEKDIIKVALLLPGVQTVGEGATGFNVRGSPADQNQFYINRVPVYNSSHLFGFFSAFNSDAVSNFTLLKGNIPSEYGGRLSSIFEITAKTGDFNKFNASGGISPITARIVAEGPIVKDQSSYMVGVRSTYSNWILRSVKNPDLRNSRAYFGDAIGNFAIKLNQKNEIRLFTYYSYDDADIAKLSQNNYTNAGAAITWNRYIRDKHALELSLVKGTYTYEDRNKEYEQFAYKLSYQLDHTELRANMVLKPVDNHRITVGANSIFYKSKPGDYLPLNDISSVQPRSFEAEQGLETGVFLEDQWDINNNLTISGGLRYNVYNYLGQKTVYDYFTGVPREITTIADTLHFAKNENIKTYEGLDYRFSARYIINENLSVKGSYNKLHQYIFMLSNTIAISPTDAWKLADYNIKPMTGDQYSLGVYSNVFAEIFEVSVEAYYKDVKNLVEFKDGAQILANEFPETQIVQGDLTAKGIEFMVKKPLGRLNGWVNYTWSKAQVQVDNPATGEQNNYGIPYPANYDKPHAFNLVANYKISKRFGFSGNLVYATGRPITYPTAIYYQDEIKLVHYSRRNEYRLPDYFRIDVSFNLEGNLKAKKFAHGSWNFSVYNLTGRKNAYSVYFRSEEGKIIGYKLSIFGSPIFSITYNFKLGNYND